MENVKNNNGQNNGQQVRVEAPKSSKNNFLKSFVSSTAGKVTMCILGVATLTGAGVWGYRRYQAKKKATQEQEPAANAAAEPTKK